MLNGDLTSAVQSLAARIDAHSAHVGVIGLGAVGSVSARLIAAAGFRVTGIDRDAARVAQLRALPEYQHIAMDVDTAALADVDIVFVAVRIGVRDGETDLAAARSAFTALAASARHPPLILFESTVPPGSTRALAREVFGEGSLQWALCAHCPERLRVGDDIEAVRTTPRLIGGLSAEATALGASFLEQLGITAVAAANPETTELSKLLENTFLTTGIALMGEITRIAHALGVNAQDVAAAAGTKSHGYFAFRPGAGIGGHCLINDLQILRTTAAGLGVDSPMLSGVAHAADQLTHTVIGRLEEVLARKNVDIGGARVCIVGVGFKPDSADVTNSAAIELVRALRTRGADVGYLDSLVGTFVVDGVALRRNAAAEVAELDAVVLLGGDRGTDLTALAERVPATLDASGRRLLEGARHLAATL